ncbi:helix-turn-helix transcriptional regulator [Alteromonas ponticola]|uniref:Helix-turn-helix transcriptional regulator n=1 Tax=Alteromonas ponticola TaxID=2720613 RepID=A0ABX1QZ61_9ALTE|nr:helix-turn-helix transcriptional regulator [Alteromonas ponticola]NMH59510.1 helix-turn-helix transcriptional regulator [Alteromonas ponticola]
MEIAKDKLIELRKERGWSQNRLATISGLGERTVQRIEKEGVCSLESVLALASVFELSPKDLQVIKTSEDKPLSDNTHPINWSGLIGFPVLMFCAYLIIDLTGKYPNWERISSALILGLTFVFAGISHGAREIYSCLISTTWVFRIPVVAKNINAKISLVKSLHEYACIVGIVSSAVCGLTIMMHTEIDPEHMTDYLTYALRPLFYAILFAELWFRPFKHRLEYILQLSTTTDREKIK